LDQEFFPFQLNKFPWFKEGWGTLKEKRLKGWLGLENLLLVFGFYHPKFLKKNTG